MQTVSHIKEMESLSSEFYLNKQTVAYVPTMGSLHEGHVRQIELAKRKAGKVIVSIFINPRQFGPNDEIIKYPSNLDIDLEICKKFEVDVVFTPKVNSMFSPDFSTYVVEEKLSNRLSGPTRAYFFKGYATVITMFLNIIRPDVLVLGQKDIHQTSIVKKVVKDLHFPVQTIVQPIVREADGLACATSNRFLDSQERIEAKKIYEALQRCKDLVAKGVTSPDRVLAEATHIITQSLKLRVVYISLVDPSTLEPVSVIVPKKTVLIISVWLGNTRLNDNITL